GDPHADAERAFVQALPDQGEDLLHFIGGGGAVDRLIARQECAAVLHYRHARGNVSDGGAVVDQRLALTRAVPRGDGRDADLHLERGGDAVAGLEAVVLGGLAVRVEVDEAGSDDQALGVDGLAAAQRAGGHGSDLSGADADVADSVEIGGGVHDAAVGDYEVV